MSKNKDYTAAKENIRKNQERLDERSSKWQAIRARQDIEDSELLELLRGIGFKPWMNKQNVGIGKSTYALSTIVSAILVYTAAQGLSRIDISNDEDVKNVDVGLLGTSWDEVHPNGNISGTSNLTIEPGNLTISTVKSYLNQSNAKNGFVNDTFNASLTNTFLYDGNWENGSLLLHSQNGTNLEFIINTSLENGVISPTSLNAYVEDGNLDLVFENDTYVNGSFEGKINTSLVDSEINGNALINDLNLIVEGGLEGRGSYSFSNDTYMNATLEGVTLDNALLDLEFTNATRLDNASVYAQFVNTEMNGNINASFENTTLDGDIDAYLDNTTLNGELVLQGNEFNDFIGNCTFGGSGTFETVEVYANGNVTKYHNITLEELELMNFSSDSELKLYLNNTNISGNVKGILNNTEVVGDIKGYVNAGISGEINGTIDALLKGGMKGNVRNGSISGGIDGKIDGSMNGYFNADFVNGTVLKLDTNERNEITFNNTKVKGFVNGTGEFNDVTMYMHGNLTAKNFNATVVGETSGGNLTGYVNGTAKSRLYELWLGAEDYGRNLSAKLGGNITATIHRAALEADVYMELENNGAITIPGKLKGETTYNSVSKYSPTGSYAAIGGGLTGLLTCVGVAKMKRRREAEKRAYERELEAKLEKPKFGGATNSRIKKITKKANNLPRLNN